MKVDCDADMAAEYDFRNGVRGKHARALREGYTVTIHGSVQTDLAMLWASRKNVLWL